MFYLRFESGFRAIPYQSLSTKCYPAANALREKGNEANIYECTLCRATWSEWMSYQNCHVHNERKKITATFVLVIHHVQKLEYNVDAHFSLCLIRIRFTYFTKSLFDWIFEFYALTSSGHISLTCTAREWERKTYEWRGRAYVFTVRSTNW